MVADELLEIYDENDEPLGKTKHRGEVHRDGDWHRTVHVYIVNGFGELLVHLRSPYKDSTPNCWDTRFGGHVKSGVRPLDAAVSELFEELGIAVDPGELAELPKQRYDGATNREHIYPFMLGKDLNFAECRFNDGEVVEVRWLSPEQIISEMDTTPERWGVMVDSFKKIVPLLKHGRN